MRAKFKKNDKKRIIAEGKFLRFVKKGEWEHVERVNCTGAVVILAMTNDKKILFVEQYRPAVGKNVIEFPAGLVNDRVLKRKESLSSAAKRELLEETGYSAKRIIKLLEGPVSSGISSDKLAIVRAVGLKKTGPGGGDETEDIKVHEIELDKVDRWLRKKENNGCVIGTRIYAGLYFLNQGS